MKKVANLMLSCKSNQQACDYILSNFIVGNIPATMMKLLHTPGQLSGVMRAITEIAPKYLICSKTNIKSHIWKEKRVADLPTLTVFPIDTFLAFQATIKTESFL